MLDQNENSEQLAIVKKKYGFEALRHNTFII
jgi:hypothetical protein